MIIDFEGQQHEFPDDFSQADIARALSTVKNPPKEDVTAGMALRGVPVLGAYVPQAEAAIRAFANPVTGVGQAGESYGERYAKNLAESERQYRMAEQESPGTSTALKIGGATAPFLLAGPVAGVGRALGVAPGMTVGGRVAAGGITGGGISAADALARGEDPVKAGVIGTGLGVALPAIGAAAGQAARGYAPAAEQQLAANIARRAVEADFPLPAGGAPGTTVPPAMAARTAELGPTGFAGEHGANTRATLQGLVTEEGPARQMVTQAFEQRTAGHPQRLEDAITGAFGPRQDLAQLTIGERLAQGLESSPLYDAFRNTSVYPTPQIRALLPRLQEDGLLAEATRRMRLQGQPVDDMVFNTFQLGGTPGPRGPTVEVWDYVKRAIDGRIGVAQRQGDRDLVRIYSGVKQELDQAIANSNPEAAQVWRQARDTWASREALINARDEGQQLWKRGVRRDQLRQELMGMSMPERLAFREGARDALAEAIDASVNGDTQVARMLRAPANVEKAHMLGGDPGRVAGMLQEAERIAEETAFHRQLLQNSQTAIKQSAAARLRPPEVNTGFFRTLDLAKPSTWVPFAERGYTNWRSASDLARQQRANEIVAQQLLRQGQPGQQSLVRLMQPPPIPPYSGASRVGAFGAQGFQPFY